MVARDTTVIGVAAVWLGVQRMGKALSRPPWAGLGHTGQGLEPAQMNSNGK
jgi:hypothetical protein